MSNASHTVSGNQLRVTHQVSNEEAGLRLDQFMKNVSRRRSRQQIQEVIDSGRVEIERKQSPHLTLGKIKPSLKLFEGDVVTLINIRKPEPRVDLDYKVLFEDETLLVIDKPANLPVHPAGKYYFNTLLVHLRSQGYTAPMDANKEFYLVHRIDKETSGILVLTKTSETSAHLCDQFSGRTVKKTYLAIVKGVPKEKEFTVKFPLGRDPQSKIRLKMTHIEEANGGLNAETEFKCLDSFSGYSLIECHPHTGRQHQIRIHLALSGYPIVGDKLYGLTESEAYTLFEDPYLKDGALERMISPETQAKLILERHALHAHAIDFIHPVTNKSLRLQAPLTKDLVDFIEKLKNKD